MRVTQSQLPYDALVFDSVVPVGPAIAVDLPAVPARDQVLFSYGRTDVTQADLQTLDDGEWLSSAIMDARIAHLIASNTSGIRYMHLSSMVVENSRAIERMRIKTGNDNPFKHDVLFVTMNPGQIHWIAGVVVRLGRSKPVMHILDSMKKSKRDYERYRDTVNIYLQRQVAGAPGSRFRSLKLGKVVDVTQQENDFDCGVFVLKFISTLINAEFAIDLPDNWNPQTADWPGVAEVTQRGRVELRMWARQRQQQQQQQQQ